MFKVGDEVYVKGEVVGVMDAVPYPTKVKLGKGEEAYVFSNDEICFADKIVKTYADGLNDAWELAKKIGCVKEEGGMSCDVLEDVYGLAYAEDVFAQYTGEEALAKIEAYEKKIKVGDVVVKTSGAGSKYIGVVTQITDAQYSVCLVFSDGSTETTIASNLTKTGKHIDIESLLRQIGE